MKKINIPKIEKLIIIAEPSSAGKSLFLENISHGDYCKLAELLKFNDPKSLLIVPTFKLPELQQSKIKTNRLRRLCRRHQINKNRTKILELYHKWSVTVEQYNVANYWIDSTKPKRPQAQLYRSARGGITPEINTIIEGK